MVDDISQLPARCGIHRTSRWVVYASLAIEEAGPSNGRSPNVFYVNATRLHPNPSDNRSGRGESPEAAAIPRLLHEDDVAWT